MKLLAFETATEACSVALYIDGEVYERFDVVPKQHTALALPWAELLLAQAGLKKSELDAIAVGIGPGAFTGVRLAVALVQGIALALDKPVLPVSTLAALAMQGADMNHDRILAAIDARMGEIYCAEFRLNSAGLVEAISEEIVIAPEAYRFESSQQIVGVGTGFSASNNALQANLASQLIACRAEALPHAADIARLGAHDFKLGKAIAPDILEPAYLRNKVALTLKEQGKS
ncbi:MAG: tRNA (adenosine(37)-N6)-threonylcarbamoyltransferase complex dimerization subunit type 1 TsaB [Arenimonas sp.]